MDRIRVAIVDDNESVVRILEEVLKSDASIDLAGVGSNGGDALDIIRRHSVDVMLLDMIMPKMDGLEVMEKVREEISPERRPAFIVISAVGHENVAGDAFELGASYYLMKPFNSDIVLRRVKQAYFFKTKTASGHIGVEKFADTRPETDLADVVTDFLHQVGIPANIRGYQYLRNAVIIVVRDAEAIHSITKTLYPEIAKINHTTVNGVERCIRHAIEVAWERGNTQTLEKSFGFSISQGKGKPTNSEFIALAADRIRLKYKGRI